MKSIRFVSIILVIALISCQKTSNQEAKISSQEHLVLATIWFQNSPEMKALFYQGFNLAKARLSEFAKQKTQKPKAVVVDIDETMMDNSPFQAQQILDSQGFTSETWKEWTDLARAKATPGAVEFTHFCDSLGVTVIYISNRKVNEIESTLKNLDSLGFSFAKKENLLFKEDVSSKKIRRDKVSEKYEIVMLIGDNLNDLSEVFESRDDDWGSSVIEKYKNEFGNRFIVLPNPMYGDWEKNIYGKAKIPESQMQENRIKVLEGYK
ncbi:MAG: 5'-nucleotidase, lipoprotein e(P4) family [Tenuifilaceae bacterium]